MDKHKIKIDELKKDNVFKVPEGYFEDLPSIIQSRVTQPAQKERHWMFQPAVKWAAVAASVLIFTVYFSVFRTGSNENSNSSEFLLAQVNSEDLIAYLEYSDISTDELIASVEIGDFNLEEMESENLFLEDIDIDELESIDLLETIDVSPELL